MVLNNITYSHEHMVIDLAAKKNNPDCYLNVYEEGMDELKKLRQLGVTRLVDCSNHGIGVNWEIAKKIEAKTGIKILLSTGYYKDPFFPEEVQLCSVEQLAERMHQDLLRGASLIGEIGTSHNEITESERKVFEAACLVHHRTQAVIITHTTLGTMALEQGAIFCANAVNPSKVILSHVALADDLRLMLKLASMGFNLAFDTIGKENYLSDQKRADFIIALCKAGYQSQLVMSMDLTRKSHLKKNGGKGYSWLLEHFVPLLLQKGLAEATISQILQENFTEILGE